MQTSVLAIVEAFKHGAHSLFHTAMIILATAIWAMARHGGLLSVPRGHKYTGNDCIGDGYMSHGEARGPYSLFHARFTVTSSPACRDYF